MAQLTIHVGDKNESTFSVDLNPDRDMISIHTNYNIESMGQPHPYSRDWLTIHADSFAELQAFVAAINRAMEIAAPAAPEVEAA